MHLSALEYGRQFFASYTSGLQGGLVVDIGAQDVNGSLRNVCPPQLTYCGVDFVDAKGVDVVITDPYKLPLEDNAADVVVCSSCFEHSEMFWLLFLEILRILKPHGVLYLNAPSNGYIHRYPMDCWRFYPDAGRALVSWGERSGFDPVLLESFVGGMAGLTEEGEGWNDFVAVILKSRVHADRYPQRILDGGTKFFNGLLLGQTEFLQPVDRSEEQQLLTRWRHVAEEREAVIARKTVELAAAEQDAAGTTRDLQACQAQLHGAHDALEHQKQLYEQQLAQLRETLQRRDQELSASAANAEVLSSQISDIHASTSWRITAPLRRLRSTLGRT